MLTSTHILLGAALTTRPKFKPQLIALGWFGGLLPDLSIMIMFAYSRITDMPRGSVWRAPDGLYWQEPWQTYSEISNSMPLWITLALVGWFIFQKSARYKPAGLAFIVLGVAALSHTLGDFPVHTDDAHVHFWPITDWRFHSIVSYYQSAHFGDVFRWFEMAGAFLLATYLVVRFKQWPVRVGAVILGFAPVVMSVIARVLF